MTARAATVTPRALLPSYAPREIVGLLLDAPAIEIEAQAKLGEFLKAEPMNKGGRPSKTGAPGAPVQVVKTST